MWNWELINIVAANALGPKHQVVNMVYSIYTISIDTNALAPNTRWQIWSTQYIISTDLNEYHTAIFHSWINRCLNFTSMIISISIPMISWLCNWALHPIKLIRYSTIWSFFNDCINFALTHHFLVIWTQVKAWYLSAQATTGTKF